MKIRNSSTAAAMDRGWDDELAKHRGSVLVILLLILLVGAYFRLANLGLPAFRADEGFFWDIFPRQLSAGEIVNKWLDLQGLSGQLPFSAAFTKWFVDTLGLPVTHFTVRLPSALWGITTILAAYGAGLALHGRFFGLMLALILAMNPYHIQMSREAYHYPPLIEGAFLGLWASVWIVDHLRNGKPLSPLFYGVNGLAFFLLTYSQPSGWPLAVLVSLTMTACLAREMWLTKRFGKPQAIVLGSYLFIGIPLLLVPWGLKQMIEFTSTQNREHLLHIFGSNAPFLPALWRVISSFAWGSTPIRGSFTIVVLCLGLGVCLRKWREDKRVALLIGFSLVGFVMAMLSRRSAGMPFSARYVVALLPLYLILLTMGIVQSAELFRFPAKKRVRHRRTAQASLLGVAVLLWAPAAFYCTQSTGKPTPYKPINTWVDANLPRGTLILVDRWFEPWCELRTEPVTNVIYTYTVPDEPLDVYLQSRWRDRAIDFFNRNPDAAFCEICKHYWEDPKAGPWLWPRQFFAQRVAFTNEAGLKLRELGLANRGEFYDANTNRLIVELFYNKREDLLVKAKAANQEFAVFFGNGPDVPLQVRWNGYQPYASLQGSAWGYTKTQDYRDWRVLESKAQLDLYNLTSQTNQAFVTVTGVAVPSAKRIQLADGATYSMPGNQLATMQIGPLLLPPGQTVLELSDVNWEKSRVPLLVDSIAIGRVSAATNTTATASD